LIRLLTAVNVAALTAGQVAAHICVRPDPLQTFAVAHAAPETWVVLLGRLDYPKGDKVPDAQDMQHPHPPACQRAGSTSRFPGLSACSR